MPTLHLGVLDVPYQQRRLPGKRKTAANVSTGDVAEWLERRYGVMEAFYRQNEQAIADKLTQALVDAGEAIMQGAPVTIDPFGAGTSQIEDRFKQFLALQEMDKLGVPGVPTQAAQEGRSARFKRGKSKGGAPRPSFVDTGLYMSSMKAWVDDEYRFTTELVPAR
jgi:hypothetical protein